MIIERERFSIGRRCPKEGRRLRHSPQLPPLSGNFTPFCYVVSQKGPLQRFSSSTKRIQLNVEPIVNIALDAKLPDKKMANQKCAWSSESPTSQLAARPGSSRLVQRDLDFISLMIPSTLRRKHFRFGARAPSCGVIINSS